MISIFEQLQSVLCDPEGKCCISGSDSDRAVVDSALERMALLEKDCKAAQENHELITSLGNALTVYEEEIAEALRAAGYLEGAGDE